MQKKSTSLLAVEPRSVHSDKTNTPVKPSTVRFLRQFARAYSCDIRLGSDLGSVILN